jgi:H+/Cl- antiporter ClcA
MPSISIGASIGAIFSDFLTIDYTIVVVMSMIAYLSAVIRSPITASLVILEMTTSLNLILPALIIAFASNYISSKIQKETLFLELSKTFK